MDHKQASKVTSNKSNQAGIAVPKNHDVSHQSPLDHTSNPHQRVHQTCEIGPHQTHIVSGRALAVTIHLSSATMKPSMGQRRTTPSRQPVPLIASKTHVRATSMARLTHIARKRGGELECSPPPRTLENVVAHHAACGQPDNSIPSDAVTHTPMACNVAKCISDASRMR